MADFNKGDKKAAQDALRILLNILPKSERGIHDISYSFGLICRETGIEVEQAVEIIMSWSDRLRALPNFKELYPRYRKLSFYRYQVRYALQSAYKRTQDKPSSHKFKALTGQKAPAASFWDNLTALAKESKPEKDQ